jgi:hypothetical protein
MDSARSGQYCLGSVTAVAIAVVLGCLVAGPYVPKVCLNKLDHPLRQADLFSNPSTSLRPFCPEIRSPPTHLHCHSTPTPPPTEQPSCLQIQIQQAQLFWALTRWAHPPPPGNDIEAHHLPPATRFQQILRSAGAISINGFVVPPSTAARRGSSTCL